MAPPPIGSTKISSICLRHRQTRHGRMRDSYTEQIIREYGPTPCQDEKICVFIYW